MGSKLLENRSADVAEEALRVGALAYVVKSDGRSPVVACRGGGS